MQRLSIHDTCITLNFPWQIKVGAHASICKRRVLRTIKRTESRITQCLSWTVLSVWIWWRKFIFFFFILTTKESFIRCFFTIFSWSLYVYVTLSNRSDSACLPQRRLGNNTYKHTDTFKTDLLKENCYNDQPKTNNQRKIISTTLSVMNQKPLLWNFFMWHNSNQTLENAHCYYSADCTFCEILGKWQW